MVSPQAKVTPRIRTLIKKYSKNLSLDAGCGHGDYFCFFNGNVVGIDLDLSSLKKVLRNMRSGKGIFLVQADVRFLPFAKNVFDFVLCSQAIEHIPENDAKRVIRQFEEIVQFDKVILIDTPNTNLLQESLRRLLHISWVSRQKNAYSFQQHRSFYTKSKLEKMGFRVNGCLSHWGGNLFPRFFRTLYDIATWNLPEFAGTLIGIRVAIEKRAY
jgi:SAM-dependent methyltransferase